MSLWTQWLKGFREYITANKDNTNTDSLSTDDYLIVFKEDAAANQYDRVASISELLTFLTYSTYVPYSGATGDVDLGSNGLSTGKLFRVMDMLSPIPITGTSLDIRFDSVAYITAIDRATSTYKNINYQGSEHIFYGGHIRPHTTNIYDLGTSSKKWKDLHIVGVANAKAIKTTLLSGALTNPPTAAELISLIGVCATLGSGYEVNVYDSANAIMYNINTDGTDWFYVAKTKAV